MKIFHTHICHNRFTFMYRVAIFICVQGVLIRDLTERMMPHSLRRLHMSKDARSRLKYKKKAPKLFPSWICGAVKKE